MSMRLSRIAGIALATLVACDDSTGPDRPPLAFGAIVLNTYGEPGITVTPEDSGASTHIDFGSSFDAAAFTLHEDTVLATSSKSGGDLLYIAELSAGSLRTVQLPAGSNPANVAVVPTNIPGADSGRYAVALRDSGAIAQVRLDPAGDRVRVIANAGLCPTDVIFHGAGAWSVDANQTCFSDYTSQGPSRLVFVPLLQAGRDTIELAAAAVGAQRAFLIGDDAFIYASGDYFQTSASVSRVDLSSRQITGTLPFPAGVYGAAMRLGADGLLYVTAAEASVTPYAPRVYTVDPETMTFQGPFLQGAQHRTLIKSDGSQAACAAATADQDGRIYCVENGNVLATLLVFNPDGSFVRSAPAGTLAADITLR